MKPKPVHVGERSRIDCITVKRTDPLSSVSPLPWRAFCQVPDALRSASGVCGGATDSGPWCEGFGETPALAIASLERVLGAAVISTEFT